MLIEKKALEERAVVDNCISYLCEAPLYVVLNFSENNDKMVKEKIKKKVILILRSDWFSRESTDSDIIYWLEKALWRKFRPRETSGH